MFFVAVFVVFLLHMQLASILFKKDEKKPKHELNKPKIHKHQYRN